MTVIESARLSKNTNCGSGRTAPRIALDVDHLCDGTNRIPVAFFACREVQGGILHSEACCVRQARESGYRAHGQRSTMTSRSGNDRIRISRPARLCARPAKRDSLCRKSPRSRTSSLCGIARS